jgi:hypothetical protein
MMAPIGNRTPAPQPIASQRTQNHAVLVHCRQEVSRLFQLLNRFVESGGIRCNSAQS